MAGPAAAKTQLHRFSPLRVGVKVVRVPGKREGVASVVLGYVWTVLQIPVHLQNIEESVCRSGVPLSEGCPVSGGWPSRPVVLRARSLGQLLERCPGNCYTCGSRGPTPDLLSQKRRGRRDQPSVGERILQAIPTLTPLWLLQILRARPLHPSLWEGWTRGGWRRGWEGSFSTPLPSGHPVWSTLFFQ